MLKRLDYCLLVIVAILLLLGISFLAALSAPYSLKSFGTTNYFLFHQLIYGLLPGVVFGIFVYFLPLNFLKKISPLLFLINFIFLLLVFLPQIGSRFLGANRWLNFFGVILQPSEFLKITSILYLSSWLKSKTNYQTRGTVTLKKRKVHYGFKEVFLPFLFFLVIISLVFYFQPDISTLVIIGLTSLVIYFAAGTPFWNIFLIIGGGIAGLFLLVKFEPYRLSRLIVFLNPEIDPLGIGFQIKQALIAVGSGGLFGRGLGMSSQKFVFLPHSMSDSTFAIFAEETGFVGIFILILLFLLFLWLGLVIARRSEDKFGRLAALGITFWIVFQGFVNISSTIGLLPLGGIPLPFISYGGSHLISELLGVGILLNIAKRHAN